MPGLKLKNKAGGNYPPVLSLSSGRKIKPIYTGAGAVYEYDEAIAVMHSYVDRFKEPYTNYKMVGKATSHPRIMLPRSKFPLGHEDRRLDGYDIDVDFIGKPRNEDQERVCRELREYYEIGRTGIIVNASTGFGKTFVGCYAIAQVKKTALVLVTKSDLEGQWRDSFKKFLGFKDSDIGLMKADKFSVADKKVVIGYVQSVMKDDRYPSWIYKYFGMIISDEIHLMAAEKFGNCMWLLPAKYRLGLSATIDRSDGREHVFKEHIGRTLITAEVLPMKFIVCFVKTNVLVPDSVPFKAGRTMALNNFLGLHQSRQALVTEKIMKAYAKDRNIVCFADTKKHLEYAYDCLINAGAKMKDIGFYVGLKSNAKQIDKDNLKKEAHKRIVLATYKMTQYGTDFPHWDTAVLMTPRADVRQIVGRVVREKEGKKTPVVFDFVDPVPLLMGYFKSRRTWYRTKAERIIGG